MYLFESICTHTVYSYTVTPMKPNVTHIQMSVMVVIRASMHRYMYIPYLHVPDGFLLAGAGSGSLVRHSSPPPATRPPI